MKYSVVHRRRRGSLRGRGDSAKVTVGHICDRDITSAHRCVQSYEAGKRCPLDDEALIAKVYKYDRRVLHDKAHVLRV